MIDFGELQNLQFAVQRILYDIPKKFQSLYSMRTSRCSRKFTKELKIQQYMCTNFKNIPYDSFIFIDNVTHQKIVLKDAKGAYEKKNKTAIKDKHPQSTIRNQTGFTIKDKEVQELNDCLSIMKTTKLFQLDSLRSNIFKSVAEPKHETQDSFQKYHRKKRQFREVINSTIYQFTRKELTDYLNKKIKHPREKIINLTKNENKFTKKNLKMLEQLTTNQNPAYTKHRGKQKIVVNVQIKDQQQIKAKLINHLHRKIKDNCEYLIKPSIQEQLYQKINQTHKQTKSVPILSQQTKKDLICQDMHFKPSKINSRVAQIKQKIEKRHQKLTPKQKQTLMLASEGLLFDLQMQIVTDPSLINVTDSKGNTLLHIAAKYNHVQIFEYILKKLGVQSLKVKNNFDKTPVDLARLFAAHDTKEIGMKTLKAFEMF